jgi:hypothetical protein
MKITKKKTNFTRDVKFCFTCGKELNKHEYILNFGSNGATFELCEKCIKKLNSRINKILSSVS